MARLAVALVVLACLAFPTPVSSAPDTPSAGQAAQPPATPPTSPVKFYRPVKGLATIEVVRGVPKRVGGDMVTVIKVRNTSEGRIDLLIVDEYWYDKDLQHVSGTTERLRKPFNPGDILEMTLKSPVKANLYRSQLLFRHTHGKVDAKEVKSFDDKKK